MKNADSLPTTTAPHSETGLNALFPAVAERCSGQTALITDDGALSYAELAARVTAATEQLSDGGRPGVPVLVDTPGSGSTARLQETLVRMLAALVAGRPLVPIDGSLPAHRREVILRRCADAELPGCAVLIFTSGSTGVPKAVRQPEAMWRNQIRELSADLEITAGSTVLSALPVSFGGGLDIALTALFSGATFVPAEPRRDGVERLIAALRQHRPDSLHLAPALLRTLTAHPAAASALPGVHLVATCGEAPDAGDIARLRSVAPETAFGNRAGSSETGNLAFDLFPPDRPLPAGTLVPGRLAAGKSVTVHDESGALLPPGAVGRLRVASPYLASGYLTDAGPVDFPTDAEGRRVHDLGDLGALVDGRLRLAGRSDDAVKIRGYLVDVSEVTAALRRVDGIADAVAVARGDRRRELVGYLEPAAGVRPPSPAAVRAALAELLPLWMRPAHLVLLPHLPRTERGKIDRAALPAPEPRPRHRAPITRTERLLAPLWEDLLQVSAVGIDDDFTALGGDSLTAVALADRIAEAFAVSVPLSELTAATTLHDLAALIDRHADGAVDAPAAAGDVVELSPPAARRAPLMIAFAGAGEAAHAFLPVARRLTGYRLVGIQAHGLERRGFPDWTIRRAARRAVRQVTALDPHGPYRFVGHSLGGILAVETARLLRAQGREVTRIVCLDTVLDEALRRGSAIDFPLPGPAAGTTAAEPLPDDTASVPSAATGRWRTRLQLLSAGLVVRPAATQWSLFHELGRRTALLHRLTPWDGALTVIKAEGNTEPDLWWQRVAPNCGPVQHTAGDHNGMLRPPHAGVTAERIAAALDPTTPGAPR